MGKHALYVWGSFGVTALLMIIEPLLLRSRSQQIRKRIARRPTRTRGESMKARHKRLGIVIVASPPLGLATFLVLNALEATCRISSSPTEVADGKAPANHIFSSRRPGRAGSVTREEGSLTVNFVVTDMAKSITVAYSGIPARPVRRRSGA